MIAKCRCFIRWKYSWILLLVPYLNLIFVVLFLMFAAWKHYIYLIPVLFLGSLSMYLLNKIISEQNTWLIPMIVTTFLSLLSFIYLKRSNWDFYVHSRKKLVIVFIYFAVIAVVFISAFFK